MIKWAILLSFGLFSFAPIYDRHDTFGKVGEEIKNMENSVQPKQWRVLRATPTLNDLQDDECVKVSSNGWVSIQCRDGREIYGVKLSCVTVIR